jgi:cobyrinic acid a,c-diamide synthase
MSIPRVLIAPTHRTGLADAIAATVAEVATNRGQTVRYHHLGPLSPGACWDRWEGAAFIDPALYEQDALLGLYDVATRGATLSLLSSTCGLLDRQDGVAWLPVDVARLLDCPVVVLIDCRGWGTGVRALVSGLRSHLAGLNLAAAILSGVSDREHLALLRQVLAEENLPVVGCLYDGDGPGWDTAPPGAWGLPLESTLVEAVYRQVDTDGLVSVAGQRGFLSWQSWLTDRGADGPVVAVAGGKGFTPWSRDSIEVLRSAGADVRRLDLLEHTELPPGTAGLILAGTLWPGALADIAMNVSLLRTVRERIEDGLPTLALGGGMLTLVERVHDSLGRRADLAGVVPGSAEILWDLEEPAYVRLVAEQDNLLIAKDETLTGWVLTETEVAGPGDGWGSPLSVVQGEAEARRPESAAAGSLVCSRVLMHLGATPDMAPRFVRRCAAYAASRL